MENVIKIKGLVKHYGSYTAVRNLDLEIGKGEVFGLLGPNGAGKSTTILMLMGLTEPDEGEISVCGIDPVHKPIEVKRLVGYLPEDVGFYDDYSGLENLVYTGLLNGLTRRESRQRAVSLLDKVGMSDEKDKKTGKYSRGMRQRLGLADVLMKKPEVIILDEPTLGIDPAGVRDFLDLIVELSRKERITVLFSSHHLHQVQQVCDRVGIFVKGNLLAEGRIGELSEKLFPGNKVLIEGHVEHMDTSGTLPEVLLNELQQVKGCTRLRNEERRLFIEAEQDITAAVARILVNSGLGLLSLNRREYGLDEIYLRYFEGTA